MQNLKVLNLASIPQTISILCVMKKILEFSMVESKSLDDSTVRFIYLGLSTVKSESLDFSIEKCDINVYLDSSHSSTMLYQIKKRLDFSVVEVKSLEFSTVGVIYLSLSTVEPKSLDFSLKNMKVLNWASIP